MLFDMPEHLLLWISQFLGDLFVLELQQPYELLVLKQGLLDTLATVLFSMTGLLGAQVVMLFARTVPRDYC